MSRFKVRNSIRTHHWLLLFIYLFPLGYLFYCLNTAPDSNNDDINIAQKDTAENVFKHHDNGTSQQPQYTCDVSEFDKKDNSAICQYILHNCDEDFFKISQVYYCDGDNSKIRIGLGFGVFVALVIIFMIFGLITSNFLYPNLDLLSKHMKISNRISGLTLLALGNATPDIFSTFSAFNSNSSSLAIGELLGSANFVICFVIGSMGILKPFQVNHFEFIKDLYFFMALILISLYFIHDEKLMTSECVLMIIFYLIYVNYSIFFTNEGKEPEELMSIPSHLNDEESQQFSHLTPSMVPQHQEGYEASVKSSLDDNKTKGLQKLSFYDAMKLWRAKSPEFQIRRGSGSTITSNRTKSTENIRELQVPSLPERSISTDEVSRSRSESDPLVGRVLYAPSPIQPPFIILEDPEEDEPIIASVLDEKKDSIWIYLFSPFNEAADTTSILTASTFPVLFLLNIFIPVYSKDLTTDSSSYSNLIRFKRHLFMFQLFALPFLLNYTLVTTIPHLLAFLTSCALSILNLTILKNQYIYTIPLVGFLSSVLFIITTSSHLITILKNIGVIFRISESLLGLTVLALGNSTGDLISNLTLAELDLSVIGINACFGSPLLYILIGIGINGLIVNFRNGQKYMPLEVDTNFKMSSLGLVLMLIFYAVVIPLNGWFIDRKVGAVGVIWWIIITGINVYLETN